MNLTQIMPSTACVAIQEFGPDTKVKRFDEVVTEEPLEIRISCFEEGRRVSKSVSVTMRTPGADFELALGFLYTEGILRDFAAIDWSLAHSTQANHNCNVIEIPFCKKQVLDFARLTRHVYTTSSCGVCGKTSLEHVKTIATTSPRCKVKFSKNILASFPDTLSSTQVLFSKTGGIHAAALFDASGSLLIVREDVGRHNAMDKLIGALFLERKLPASDTAVLVSGRASFELVQKAAIAGIPILVSVGAPTSLAISLAEEFNMTLVGFLRAERMNIYAGDERIEC